jgi:hypothetical protein
MRAWGACGPSSILGTPTKENLTNFAESAFCSNRGKPPKVKMGFTCKDKNYCKKRFEFSLVITKNMY